MNLPISTNVPRPAAAPASAGAAQQGDQASQTDNPFGNVLASQLAGDAAAAGKSKSAATTTADDLIAAASDKKGGKQHGTDAANTPDAGMLAALLAGPAAAAAAAKSGQTTASTLDGKAAGISAAGNAKTALKSLPAAAVDAADKKVSTTSDANVTAANDRKQNFATALRTLDDKAHTNAPGVEIRHQAAPLPQDNPLSAAASIQPAQVNPQMANAAIPSSQLMLNTPVGNHNWGNDFNQKVTWLSTQNQHSAELQLNPPDLGPLNVVLNVDGSHASAMFTSAHAAVRDAIQQALPQLREMMANNGIMLGNATVSDQRSDNQGGQQTQRGSRIAAGSDDDIGISGVSQGAITLPPQRHNGLVDTFA